LEHWYGTADTRQHGVVSAEFLDALEDDLNTPKAIAELHQATPKGLGAALRLLGFSVDPANIALQLSANVSESEIENLIAARTAARKAKNFAESDRIRDELLAKNIVLKDGPTGTAWEVKK
jgi:cysteinyl-tRNA synthetase